jgi:hypothetical protein
MSCWAISFQQALLYSLLCRHNDGAQPSEVIVVSPRSLFLQHAVFLATRGICVRLIRPVSLFTTSSPEFEWLLLGSICLLRNSQRRDLSTALRLEHNRQRLLDCLTTVLSQMVDHLETMLGHFEHLEIAKHQDEFTQHGASSSNPCEDHAAIEILSSAVL